MSAGSAEAQGSLVSFLASAAILVSTSSLDFTYSLIIWRKFSYPSQNCDPWKCSRNKGNNVDSSAFNTGASTSHPQYQSAPGVFRLVAKYSSIVF